MPRDRKNGRKGYELTMTVPLADGSHQGNTPAPCMQCLKEAASGMRLTISLERAATLLRRVERYVARTGGYMAPEDQALLAEARRFLLECGK